MSQAVGQAMIYGGGVVAASSRVPLKQAEQIVKEKDAWVRYRTMAALVHQSNEYINGRPC